MDVTLFLVYLALYLFVVWYWMTFYQTLTFNTEWVNLTVISMVVYFIAMGYEVFYSAFILDGYYKVNNSDDLDQQLKRVWLATLSIETIRLLAFTFYRLYLVEEKNVVSMFVRVVLALHALVVGLLPIGGIVFLIESVELVDESDKMMALVAAYTISIIGLVSSLPWAYNILVK